MSDIYTKIRSKLDEIPISPIFFIGSGISRRYINAPDWKNMLKEVMNGWDKSFERQYQSYVKNGKCDFEELGKLLEDKYYNDILSDNEIVEGKEKSYYFRKKISDILELYIAKNIEALENNEEVSELRKTTPSTIITTNYDNLLEDYIFKGYQTYVGQEQLLSNVLHGVGDIYKIHGCIKNPDSIVITKDDYNHFRDKSVYLNSKLLTLFLEYPIIFMGYSFSDENIKGIFDTIVKMIPNKSKELSERIWFLRRNESGNKDYSEIERIELEEGRYLDVEVFYVNNFAEFYKVLNEANFNKLPIQFLRYMKSNVYQLVASQVNNPKLIDVNICDISRVQDFTNSKIVFTLSNDNTKLSAITKEEICDLFIGNEYKNIDLKSILKRISEESKPIYPIYRFMLEIGYDECMEYLDKIDSDEKVKTRIEGNNIYTQDIGVDKGYTFNYSGKILNNDINKYLVSYIKSFNMPEHSKKQSENTFRRYFILYLLQFRLKDLIESADFISDNRDDIIKAITKLSKNFIIKNKEEIYKLLNILKSNKYNLTHRRMLCYIDKVLYKNKFLETKNNQCNVAELEIACE